MIGRVALLVTFKKLNQNHKAYHEVIYVTCKQLLRPFPLKQILRFILILFGFVLNLSATAQNLEIPSWITGTWNNSYVSNTNMFVYWTFSTNGIYLLKGLPDKKPTCLNKENIDFKILTEPSDSLFRFQFTSDGSRYIYEFKLQEVEYNDTPVLTWSMERDNRIAVTHSTDLSLVLTKYR